jgi:sulfate/thiosulfate transport system substrate-binding protein
MRKLLMVLLLLLSFSGITQAQENAPVNLVLAAYTTPREAYVKIIPLFQAYWKEQTGQDVTFEESYQGSGAQSRAVEGGFEADVVALSLENDVLRLVRAGLVSEDWKNNEYGGMVSTSVAMFIVRPGNPKGITDWHSLAQPGIEVLTPDPATSGGAQWNVMAAYGAAYRGFVEGYEAGEAGALQYISDLFTNVSVLDASARESFLTFERGIGDVAITYENEYFAGLLVGSEIEAVYPRSTILIENPVAVVDTYVDKHGTREVAEAFVQFLYTPEAQAIFASQGYRPPVLQTEADATAEAAATEEVVVTEETTPTAEVAATEEAGVVTFPVIEDLFTIAEFGGWAEVGPTYFGEDGIYTKMIAEVKGQ